MSATPRESLIAAGAVATAATLLLVLVLTTQSPGEPNTCCPGVEFALGDPVPGTCPSAGTFATTGCLAGDFVYTIAIAGSVVTFGNVLFHIETLGGTVYVATGGEPGFSILNSTGVIATQYTAPGGVMAMTSGWTYSAGTNASTLLTSLYTILLDMGTLDPHGQGYSFVALGTGSFSGTTVVALP